MNLLQLAYRHNEPVAGQAISAVVFDVVNVGKAVVNSCTVALLKARLFPLMIKYSSLYGATFPA